MLILLFKLSLNRSYKLVYTVNGVNFGIYQFYE